MLICDRNKETPSKEHKAVDRRTGLQVWPPQLEALERLPEAKLEPIQLQQLMLVKSQQRARFGQAPAMSASATLPKRPRSPRRRQLRKPKRCLECGICSECLHVRVQSAAGRIHHDDRDQIMDLGRRRHPDAGTQTVQGDIRHSVTGVYRTSSRQSSSSACSRVRPFAA